MSQAEKRLNKLHEQNLTVNKTYPDYIEHKNVIIGYDAMKPIYFESIQNEITKLNINDGTRSSPSIYKNNNTNQYYIQYLYSVHNFSECLFDITDVYD